MTRWFADTLAKRLFLLMWATLVASHLLAYLAVQAVRAPSDPPPAGPSGARGPALPTFPSLPPTPGVPDTQAVPRGPVEPGPPPDDRGWARNGPPPDPDGAPRDLLGPPTVLRGPPTDLRGSAPDRGHPTDREDRADHAGDPPPPADRPRLPALPWPALLLDYGVRLVFIGAAAAYGARWLAAPMRRLVGASRTLGDAVATPAGPAALDDRHGTREVREAAAVFNTMARQLHAQFTSRGLMVAAMSHDLRTPLTRLRLRLEAMDASPEQRQRSVDDIRDMNALIDGALELFRGAETAEATQPTDIAALVAALVDDLAELGSPVTCEPSAPVVTQAQPAALQRVLHNLIGNALRYGGRAEVRVECDAAQVTVVVDDDGPGIAPALLETVFEPFFRIDASRNRGTGGAGLGLYIARDLVARVGGRVTVANRPAGGLQARVVLPLR